MGDSISSVMTCNMVSLKKGSIRDIFRIIIKQQRVFYMVAIKGLVLGIFHCFPLFFVKIFQLTILI